MTPPSQKRSAERGSRGAPRRGGGPGTPGGGWDPEDLRVAVVFLRSLRGWSQTELAHVAGMDKSRVSLYEQGRKIPSPRSLGKLVAAGRPPFPAPQRGAPGGGNRAGRGPGGRGRGGRGLRRPGARRPGAGRIPAVPGAAAT